jgi:hypothetical protein
MLCLAMPDALACVAPHVWPSLLLLLLLLLLLVVVVLVALLVVEQIELSLVLLSL